MSDLAITTLVRVLVFTGVFALAAHKHPKITIRPKYAIPLVGLFFALLNTGLYWLFKSIIGLATLGMAGLLIPWVLNGLFLWGTNRLIKPLKIEGTMPLIWLTVLLTLAHGVLYVAFRTFM